VPPPPVWGAPLGTAGPLGADELGGAYVNEADGLAVAVFVADADPLAEALALVDALALADALEEAVVEAPASGPDVDVPGDGVKIAGCVDEGELVHAATAAEMKTVKVAAPTAVVVVLTAALPLVARTFVRNGVFSICPLGYASRTYRESGT
jgi:hypothetical protein